MCGRKLKVPPGDKVRPTQDRVREALFAMLMTVIPDAVFIDLFAGSGAVGIEAYSRGARHVTWVEQDPRNVAVRRPTSRRLCRARARWPSTSRTGCRARTAGHHCFHDPPVWPVDQGRWVRADPRNQVLGDGLFAAEMPARRA